MWASERPTWLSPARIGDWSPPLQSMRVSWTRVPWRWSTLFQLWLSSTAQDWARCGFRHPTDCSWSNDGRSHGFPEQKPFWHALPQHFTHFTMYSINSLQQLGMFWATNIVPHCYEIFSRITTLMANQCLLIIRRSFACKGLPCSDRYFFRCL